MFKYFTNTLEGVVYAHHFFFIVGEKRTIALEKF